MDYTASYDNRVEVNKCSLMLTSASVKMIHFFVHFEIFLNFPRKLRYMNITKKYEKILDYKYRWISLFCLCKFVMLCFIWIFHLLSLHFILVLFSFYRYTKIDYLYVRINSNYIKIYQMFSNWSLFWRNRNKLQFRKLSK